MSLVFRFAALSLAALVSSAGNAQLAPIASYTSLGGAKNLYWENAAPPSGAAGGSLFTISTPTSTLPGISRVLFDFDPLSGVSATGIRAEFALLGSVANSPAVLAGGLLTQGMVDGSFSFAAKAASGGSQVIGAYTIPDGTNLLSAVYQRATISGVAGGSKALFASDMTNGTLTFTSDPMFGLIFGPSSDFQINIIGITPAFSAVPGRALSSFDPGSTGTFYTGSVPEPASWALMLVGFAVTGSALRQRTRRRVTA